MMAIRDRTGRTIPQALIDKAERIAASGGVTVETPGRLWRVTGDTGRYLVVVDSTGHAGCRCRFGRETGELCSHVMATWLYQRSIGDPVHVSRIDGYKPRLVDDVADDQIFEGL